MSDERIFQQTITVDKSHIDVNGHVNNVVYVQWMQDVAYAHSSSVGYDNKRLSELGSTWVIRSHFVKYHRPALLGDELIAYTWPGSIKKASALRKYKFVRVKDGATVASGESDWVYIDRNTGRPKAIEDEILSVFAELPADEEP
ncbi:acyl-CoA thioesterase [Pelagicoccus albus]|uniref:Acyl-CoA thioesterase n=1 Tax=Pelagicoccus albus TaxID=415222 RepID=A0A7X1B7B9_9BACT|nr:thioesterase family protein [Pelagicoccus albus]MBC2605728.1 acyl-CoA thioesterase [Pelagicoccus albus]